MTKKQTDMLSGVEHDQSPLYLSLYAFRESIKRHMGLSKFPMVQTDDAKHVLRTDESVSYPYGYFTVQDITIVRDRQAVKTIQRVGYASKDPSASSANLLKGYLFPTTSSIEMHYFASDIINAFAFAEKIGLLLAGGVFNTGVEVDSHSWTVVLDDQQSSIPIPTSTLEDESNPARHEITLTVTISYKTGIIKLVPKVNNEGRVSQSVEIEHG